MSSKQHSRRTMLKSLAAGTVAVGLGVGLSGSAGAGAVAAAAPGGGRNRLVPVNRIGIQLFTLLNEQFGPGGLRPVFERLSDIGYTHVEHFYYGHGAGPLTVPQLRTMLDDFGLASAGAHQTLTPENIDAQLDNAQILGMTKLGQGGPIAGSYTEAAPEADWLAAIDRWNAMGEKAAARGITLYLHNHAPEFGITEKGNRIYDLLWDGLNGDNVKFEMDVYWAHVGAHLYPGFKPLDYVLKDPRRFPLLHLKDGKINPDNPNGYDIVEFGVGNIDYQAFLSALRDRGGRIGLFEQDTAGDTPAPGYPVGALGNAERSYERIAALRG